MANQVNEAPTRGSDVQALDRLRDAHAQIRREIGKVIVGQNEVIDQLMVALLAGGHALLVGVPGLAKTLLISTLSQTLGLKFSRIQFTPDLMPSDITGSEILEEDHGTGKRHFRFVKGPIFANVVLADEINRTPPKTQAALLQAMQEHEVTSGAETMKLDEPFFVLATQNPIEQEGTYPLPEAQLDRFMFNVKIGYPSADQEREIVKSTTSILEHNVETTLGGAELLSLQKLIRRAPVSDHLVDYAVRLARATRPGQDDGAEFINDWVSWGAGPRASQYLILAAKTRAALDGRPTPGAEDVRFAAYPVLRHRIVTSFAAEAEGVDVDEIIRRLLESVTPKQ
ncbi:MAG: AAA family ATPase [Candidatus Zixiibacteriota bacterium]